MLRKFIYGPGIDEPICMIDVSDSNAVYYYHFDGLGSVIALSNNSGDTVETYSYDVFGEPNTAGTIPNPYLFTGRRYDSETGLYYYRARYYAYDIGRFLQTDPIGYDAGLNMYAYVGNSPTNFVDPMRLCKGDRSFGRKLWEGDYVGAQYGDSSLDRYAREIAFGNAKWYHYVGGAFSALWTPKSWKTTTVTLGTAGYGAVKARIAARSLSVASQGAGSGKAVLGKYPDYIRLADKTGAKRFSIPTKIWNKMSKAKQWGANQKFLDRAIARGDDIILSNPVKNINNATGAFRKELEYLIGKGYRLARDGTSLIK